MRYFAIKEAVPATGAWFLGALSDYTSRIIDERCFTNGKLIKVHDGTWHLPLEDRTVVEVVPPLRYAMEKPGQPLDFTLATWEVPVITELVAHLLISYTETDIQIIAVDIDGVPERYYIMNIAKSIECIDRLQSIIQWWTEDDGLPHMVGRPFVITKLVVDPVRLSGHNIIRMSESPSRAIIVSETVKQILEDACVSGINFSLVSGETGDDIPQKNNHHAFYAQLFASAESLLGRIDAETRFPIIGFDMGGPLAFATIGFANGEEFVTYISCELSVREEQLPSSCGRFELLCTCNEEAWVCSILSIIGRGSMKYTFGPDHSLDIGGWVEKDDPIQGVLLELVCTVGIGTQQVSILRVIGISRAELEFKLLWGAEALRIKLQEAGVYPNTVVGRPSAV